MDQLPDTPAEPGRGRKTGRTPVRHGADDVDRSKLHQDIGALRQMHRVQVRFYRQEQLAIAELLGLGPEGRTLDGNGRVWAKSLPESQLIRLRAGLMTLTTKGLHERLEQIDVFLARITKGALHAARAQEALVGNVDDQQLRATIREEFLRAAYTFTPAEWAMLDEVRAAQAKSGGKAAMLVGRAGLRRLIREAKAREDSDDDDDEPQDEE